MAKSLLSAIAAMALVAFAPTAAQAVTPLTAYNFDFSCSSRIGGCPNGETFSVGNSMTFRSLTDAGLQVKITAWSIEKFETGVSNTADDIVSAATLRLWSGGLGVQNKFEDGSSPNHSIDNGLSTAEGSHRMVDFVLLQFNWDSDINSMTTGWVNTDQDAALRIGQGPTSNPATWNITPALNGAKVFGSTAGVELADYINIPNTELGSCTNVLNSCVNDSTAGNPQTRDVNGSNEHGLIALIGALYGTDKYDFFKLDGLNVTVYPTIPEPSTWMTMILGFGFVGWTMRRRKVLVGKDALAIA